MSHRSEVALRSRYAFALRSGPNRSRPAGLAASIVLHLAIVLLLLIPLRHDFARVLLAGDPVVNPTDGGGGRPAYITLPAPLASARAAVVVTAPPVTLVVPTPTPPQEIPPPVPVEQVAVLEPAAATGSTDSAAGGEAGDGGGTGGGLGPGSGPGHGPGSGEGGAGRPPQLRHQVIPPDNPPKELRGVELRVTFWVDEAGKVVRVAVDPRIQDRKFAQRFTESMLSYRFRPALGPGGLPIASTYIQLVTAW